MTLAPKLAEYLTQLCGPGQQLALVKETEWSYVYKTGEKSYGRISKFLLDESLKACKRSFLTFNSRCYRRCEFLSGVLISSVKTSSVNALPIARSRRVSNG